MSTATETSWLASNGLRLSMADGGWTRVIAPDGRVLAEAPTVALAVRRARAALRKRAASERLPV